MRRVAIQGYKGCFHEEAARTFYGGDITCVECDTFEDLFKALDAGEADAAVMAIENTVSGGLIRNFELLRESGRKVVGEVYLRICQNLMALPGQKLSDIREVRTHYMAINQTRAFFERECPWIKLSESEDTAKSAMEIARDKVYGVGAVASALAAEVNGLEILASGIETYKQNFTRFIFFDESYKVEAPDKSCLCFTLPHKPGSLAQILTILSFYDMNLTRIQSLPIPGREWQYFFYADITFDNYQRYQQALSAIQPLIEDLSILGEYKKQ